MNSPRCNDCWLVHPVEQTCLDAMKANQQAFIKNTGGRSQCRACGETIFWYTHLNGKKVPYTTALQNHFINCPKAGEFKRA